MAEKTEDGGADRAVARPNRQPNGRFGAGNSGGPGRPRLRRTSLDEELRRITQDADQSPAEILWQIASGKKQIVTPMQMLALRMVFERVEGRPRVAPERRDEEPRTWSVIGLPDEAPSGEIEDAEFVEDPPELGPPAEPLEIEAEVVDAEDEEPQGEVTRDTADDGANWLEDDDDDDYY